MGGSNHPLPPNGPFQPLEGDSFKFACHPDVPCFNQCCADLKLVLTPYDILRLKNRLELKSHIFLDQYTRTLTEDDQRFPRIQLNMTDGPGKPCPFVTPRGCSVYEDRPGACRTYPLGRGSASGGRETFFLVKEDHCQGFAQDKSWKVSQWLADQGLTVYNKANDRWMEIITTKASLGEEAHRVKKIQMFFMVCYNLDRFREFVMGSRFLDMFDIPPQVRERIQIDDLSLLKLGFDWLDFALYGKKTLGLKQ